MADEPRPSGSESTRASTGHPDHVLNFALNALCDATCLQDMELRRNDEVFLDAVGAGQPPQRGRGRRGGRSRHRRLSPRRLSANSLARDTAFSQTEHLDRWDAAGVRFPFGYDARPEPAAELLPLV